MNNILNPLKPSHKIIVFEDQNIDSKLDSHCLNTSFENKASFQLFIHLHILTKLIQLQYLFFISIFNIWHDKELQLQNLDMSLSRH